MWVFSEDCFTYCLVFIEDCHTGWQTVENFCASIHCSCFNTRQVGVWSMKMMLIPCIYVLSRLTCLKNFLPLHNEFHERKYVLAWGRDFLPVQTGPGAHRASCRMGTRSFPGFKCGRDVLLTTHPRVLKKYRQN